MLSADLGARDRWVMAGLVMLGLFTAIAGVFSGRSATNYLLAKDAYGAALSSAGKIDRTLTEPGAVATGVLDDNLEILDPAKLRGSVGTAPTKAPIGDDDGLD